MLYDTQKQSSLVVFVFQMIDRICVKVQDHLNSLRNSETDAILEDVRSAESLIKDARNSKTVRRQLYYHQRGNLLYSQQKTHKHQAVNSQ